MPCCKWEESDTHPMSRRSRMVQRGYVVGDQEEGGVGRTHPVPCRSVGARRREGPGTRHRAHWARCCVRRSDRRGS